MLTAVEVTVSELGNAIILLGGTVGSVALVIRYFLKGLDHRIDEKLEPIRQELRPNSGHSLRDDVAKNRQTLERLTNDVHDNTGELRRLADTQGEQHRSNDRRLGRLERSHSGIRRGVLWVLEEHRRTAPRDGRPPRSLAEAESELRQVDDEYRFDRYRPADPAE